MFIASTYWRGSINIEKLRSFENEADAVQYVKSFDNCYLMDKGYRTFVPSFARVYEVFKDKPPRLVKIT